MTIEASLLFTQGSLQFIFVFKSFCIHLCVYACSFLCGSDCKESACSAGDPGWIPGSWRSPAEGNGSPVQYSCLGNPVDRGACRATVYGVIKELDMTERLNNNKLSLKVFPELHRFFMLVFIRYWSIEGHPPLHSLSFLGFRVYMYPLLGLEQSLCSISQSGWSMGPSRAGLPSW